MSELIKRIAVAIRDAANDTAHDVEEWCSMRMAEAAARAAIAAMREPTEAMCRAGVKKLPYQLSRECEMIWRAMCDEMLAD